MTSSPSPTATQADPAPPAAAAAVPVPAAPLDGRILAALATVYLVWGTT